MRIAICDDNIQELAFISNIVEAFKAEHCPSLTYEVFNSPFSLLDKVIEKQFDLLLLDVVMPQMSGIKLATKVRSYDNQVPIIFLTTSPEFAVDSYRVQAKDYLLKPIDKNLLYQVLLEQTNNPIDFIFIKTLDCVMRVPVSDIVYIEVIARKLSIHLIDGTIIYPTGNLSDFEEQLQPYPNFYKPYRSYLLNLHHVCKLDKDGFYTISKDTIPIPKGNFSKAKNDYMNFLME